MKYIKIHWLELLIIALLAVLVLWAVGYISNGLFGTHFELQSCWAGLSTVGSAGFLAAVKYLIDSTKNSQPGEMPNRKGELL